MVSQIKKNCSNTTAWTKEVVQEHAQTAVLIEMYTLPFYLTALTSIILPDKENKDTWSKQEKFAYDTYSVILSVCIEEMLHLQLAANLCLALDIEAKDIFQKPTYGKPVPYLAPYDPDTMGAKMPNHEALLNATLGPLNKTILDVMLDIETPTEFDTALDHTTPQYPYATIGQMYEALLQGILEVEKNEPVFSWSTEHQQVQFMLPPDYKKSAVRINQKIACFGDAQQAVNLICGQGEGLTMSPVPEAPYVESQFPVEEVYRFYMFNKEGTLTDPEDDDPAILNQYTHYGRFLWIQNQVKNTYKELPKTYAISTSTPTFEQGKAIGELVEGFDAFINMLTSMWSGNNESNFFSAMYKLKPLPLNCWKAGIVPQWKAAERTNETSISGTWASWITDNMRGEHMEQLYSPAGNRVVALEAYSQANYGLVDLRFGYVSSGSSDVQWSDWSTNNHNGQKVGPVSVASGDYAAGMKVNYQTEKYGIVDACLVDSSGHETAWLADNSNGVVMSSIVPSGSAIAGLQCDEEGEHGLIDARVYSNSTADHH